MTHHFLCFPRHVISAWALAGLAVLSGQAHAQMLPPMPADPNAITANTANAANPANSGSLAGLSGAVPALGASPGASPLGTMAPSLTPRLDQGARDANPASAAPAQRKPKPQTPSQFQRFVQESTGRLLPHFGTDLFDNPLAYASDAAAPAPSEYVLGQGDEVRIQIWGAVDYAGSHTLDRNGQINLPKIGTLNLSGVQVKDLEATLRKHVATVFNNVSVNASLGKLRGITVYVVGQAQQPGTYNLNSLSTLINAVFASGGPGVNGSMRNIRLQRNGQTITTLDLYDFIAQGDKSKDARLQPGDVIMIPPAGPRMALTGATDHAAIYEIKPGSTVKDVLALGGGVSTLVSPQKALLETIQPDQRNAPRQVSNVALTAQGLVQPLKDGDILTLLPISPAFANAVTLQGTVAQALRHVFVPGMRVQDVIPEREALITSDYYRRKNQLVQNSAVALKGQPSNDQTSKDQLSPTIELTDGERIASKAGAGVSDRVRGMVDQINWDYAVIERLNKSLLRTELIPFNLGKAVIQKDPEHNLLLQAGDVITIMSSTDLQLPMERRSRLVRVEGEVAAPGIYQALPGETLPQVLYRAGGLTDQAYLYGAEFTRESVRKQQQMNLDQLVRRLEAQLQSAGSNLAANLTGERAAQAQALQQQQQQQMRGQIDRLKNMRSKGRVTLELDEIKITKNNELIVLPNIPLEDGDTILVPSLPAFVSALGSVNNENVFLYKSGKTVGDVLRAAGPTEDAEIADAFVLRADGSIVGRSQSSWINSFASTPLMPGDTLVVPSKVDRESGYNFVVRALKDWTQILSNLGIGAAAIKTLKN